MKLFKIMAIFGLFFTSNQTLTFAVHVSQWKHPDNEEGIVTLVSDAHVEADAHSQIREWDESQVRDLTQHLSADHNCVAIIEDYCRTIEDKENFNTRFLPATACILQKSGIKAHAVDFRDNCIYTRPLDTINTNAVLNEATMLMNVYKHIETQLPARYQEDLKLLKNDIAQHVSTFTSTFAQGESNAKKQWINYVFSLHSQLFDFVLLAEIYRHISNNNKVYVCAGYIHIEVLKSAFKQAGFSRTAKTLNYSESTRLRDIQHKIRKKYYNQVDPYPPIDLKKALENMDKGISEYVLQPMSAATVVA